MGHNEIGIKKKGTRTMNIKYVTKPLPQYVVQYKSPKVKNYTLTDYVCPLCKCQTRNRFFGEHVDKTHAIRKDEVYAKLLGLNYPVQCKCGKELHYSDANKGFPVNCGKCNDFDAKNREYKNVDDAHNHVEWLKEQLAVAQAEETRLKKEAELDKIPIEKLPFPSIKYSKFMTRLSRLIRQYGINGEKERLIGLANMIDKKIA